MAGRFLVLLAAVALVACAESSVSTTATAPPATTQPAPATSTSAPPETTVVTSTTTTTAPPATTTTGPVVTAIDIEVSGGTVESVEIFDVPLDGAVRITVTADVSDEIHLHGYDLHADVGPGIEAVIEFEATIPGIFEVELETAGDLIGELRVAP